MFNNILFMAYSNVNGKVATLVLIKKPNKKTMILWLYIIVHSKQKGYNFAIRMNKVIEHWWVVEKTVGFLKGLVSERETKHVKNIAEVSSVNCKSYGFLLWWLSEMLLTVYKQMTLWMSFPSLYDMWMTKVVARARSRSDLTSMLNEIIAIVSNGWKQRIWCWLFRKLKKDNSACSLPSYIHIDCQNEAK